MQFIRRWTRDSERKTMIIISLIHLYFIGIICISLVRTIIYISLVRAIIYIGAWIHCAGVPKTGEDGKTSEWDSLGMLCDYYVQIIYHGLSQIHDVVQKSLGENRNVCCENTALGYSVAWSRSLIRNKNEWFVLDIDTVSNLKRGKSNNECMGFLWACRLLVLCLITFEYIIFTKLKCCIMNGEIW